MHTYIYDIYYKVYVHEYTYIYLLVIICHEMKPNYFLDISFSDVSNQVG